MAIVVLLVAAIAVCLALGLASVIWMTSPNAKADSLVFERGERHTDRRDPTPRQFFLPDDHQGLT